MGWGSKKGLPLPPFSNICPALSRSSFLCALPHPRMATRWGTSSPGNPAPQPPPLPLHTMQYLRRGGEKERGGGGRAGRGVK